MAGRNGKKMVGRVFQSIKRRHARQVTHFFPKINVCAWGGPREVNHMLNIPWPILFYNDFRGINLAI